MLEGRERSAAAVRSVTKPAGQANFYLCSVEIEAVGVDDVACVKRGWMAAGLTRRYRALDSNR
jgi:hypothetical protein